ncbi:MAG: bifunctional oligoribonuclease/PAP phosphatase NrnA [Treponema sp.]|jgi:phosphoesterase RecJ-like protein|nr:bifunctional oligoribonuclease/PAP phosphatase NrnA [Treponema sp.]
MAIPVVPEELIGFIKTGSKFLIAGHKEPDGDCVGSQLALSSVLRRMGKEALPCSAGPFKRTEVMPYANRFTAVPGAADRENARVIVVDCSASHRTGDLAPCLEGLPAAVIDHHATGDHPASSAETPVFLDAGAPSVSFMILFLIEALGQTPTPEEAELLFFGLCTDTGFFRHVDQKGADTFTAAARMIRAGANPRDTFQAIHGGKSLGSRILMGIILSRAEAFFEGRLILSVEKYEENQRFGLEGRDSDSLYQMLQSIAGVEAITIIRQETPENCTVGLRSRDSIDVAAIAAAFGGGGHKNAAGCSFPGVIEDLRPKLLAAFEKVFR